MGKDCGKNHTKISRSSERVDKLIGGGRVGHLTVRRSKACQGTLGKMLDPKALRYR